MAHDLDTLAVAIQLMNELGDDAVTVAKIRLVELIAANNLRAASFWREVLRACEELRAQKIDAGALSSLVAARSEEDEDPDFDADDAADDLDQAQPLRPLPAATVH